MATPGRERALCGPRAGGGSGSATTGCRPAFRPGAFGGAGGFQTFLCRHRAARRSPCPSHAAGGRRLAVTTSAARPPHAPVGPAWRTRLAFGSGLRPLAPSRARPAAGLAARGKGKQLARWPGPAGQGACAGRCAVSEARWPQTGPSAGPARALAPAVAPRACVHACVLAPAASSPRAGRAGRFAPPVCIVRTFPGRLTRAALGSGRRGGPAPRGAQV
jgi:hypothetical protein